MLHFSKIHDWQDDANVKQILVFPSVTAKVQFDVIRDKHFATYNNLKDFDDTGKGASYKLRAINSFDGDWIAIIRCGVTGIHLWEGYAKYKSISAALETVHKQLINSIFATKLDFRKLT